MDDYPTWAWTPRIIKGRIAKMEERIRRNPKDYNAKYLLENWRKRLVEAELRLSKPDGELR